jgi:hypothetical protein
VVEGRVLALVVLCACADATEGYLGYDLPFASPSGTTTDGGAMPGAQPAQPMQPTEMPTAGAASAEPDAGPDASVSECAPATADCDGDPTNGCEVDLANDPSHCGACGAACPSADCVCRDGVPMLACRPGYADCDGDALNGCEIHTDSDLQHCGACGRLCQGVGDDVLSAECSAGKCRLTCTSTLVGDCDGDPLNGCETALWADSQNCGECGVVCPCNAGVCF